MTREQLRTIADLVAIAHDEYDGCPSYRDDLERFDRLLAEIRAEAQPAPGNAAGAPAAERLSAVLAETRKSLKDDSWIDEITALDEDGEPDDFAWKVVPLDDALEAIDRIEAAAERERDEARKARDEARETAEDALWELAELRERAPGNAAALREALERIRPLVRAAGATQYVQERKALLDGALGIIDAALAPAEEGGRT